MTLSVRHVFHVSASLLLSLSVAGAADQEVFGPKHVAKIRAVTAVAMAPDGSRIAYLLSIPRKPMVEADGPAWTELHVVDRRGNDRGYVTGEVNVSDLSWMPDCKSVTFLSKRGKDTQKCLYRIDIEGGEARKVIGFVTDISAYALSPTGLEVAFLATEATSPSKSESVKMGFDQIVVEEGSKNVQVWIATIAPESPAPKAIKLVGSASELRWNPNGKQLCVALAPSSSVDDGFMRRKITLVDIESSKISATIENVGKLGKALWSPDGANLAFISAASLNDPHAGNLYSVSATGGAPKEITPSKTSHVADFVWMDNEKIGFTLDEGVQTRLGLVTIADGDIHMLPPNDQPIVTALSASSDGKAIALIGESSQHPSEVFIVYREDPNPQQLTKSNPWLSGLTFAAQEVVKFKARDGLELEGILIRPLGVKADQRTPLVLTVHGGPEAHIRNGWLTTYANPGQVLAAHGIAVFYPNYRGSTGRGVEFSMLGQGDPAGKEFDDLVDAVDHLIETGVALKAKVGITGGSYGGYATAWCATRYSDRFAAGVMFVGISDKISKTGTTDISEEEFHVHARKRPWEDFEGLLKHSPIYHVKGAKTPLIILHGKDDPRVFPGQSMELFRFLKVLNQAPVRLVLYPGEGHGNLRAASRLDYHLRMIQWFEHYLKGPGGDAPAFEIPYKSMFADEPVAK